MATLETLMTPSNLKSNILDSAFGQKPHQVYAVYDDLMDEFIIKLTQPETLVAEFPVSDTMSLLVEPTTLEVVGFQLGEFIDRYLPEFHRLNEVWDERHLAKHFARYQAGQYNPKNAPTQPIKESFYFFNSEKFDRVLATA